MIIYTVFRKIVSGYCYHVYINDLRRLGSFPKPMGLRLTCQYCPDTGVLQLHGYMDDRLAYSSQVLTKGDYKGELVISIGDKAAWVTGDETVEEYRGRGIHTYCQSVIYRALRMRGYNRALSMQTPGNLIAHRTSIRLKSKRKLLFHVVLFSKWRLSLFDWKIKGWAT